MCIKLVVFTADWFYLRTRYWGEYLNLKKRNKRSTDEDR
jgi:hypothetical protein